MNNIKKIIPLLMSSFMITSCWKTKKEPNKNVKIVATDATKVMNQKEFQKAKKQCNEAATSYDYYENCTINDTDKMIRVGNPEAKHKVVFLDYGYQKEMSVESIKAMMEKRSADSPQSHFYRWLINQNVEVIFLRHSHHMKKAPFKNTKGFDTEFAKLELEETMGHLQDVISYLYAFGQKVTLVGNGYGGMVLYHYIWRNGLDNIQHIFINGAKADVVDGKFSQNAKFKATFGSDKTFADSMIKGIEKDYTSDLYDVSLEKVTIIQGEGDYLVGEPNQKEKDLFKRSQSIYQYINKAKLDQWLKNYEKQAGFQWSYKGYTNDSTVAGHYAYMLNQEWFEENVLKKLKWDKATEGNSKYSFYSN